jgi:hypothetical protein
MDLLTILVAAAETAEGAGHEEHDATPFYIAGGALAAFAVIVGIIGIRRPSLPEGPNRAIMAIGAILVIATVATSIAVS